MISLSEIRIRALKFQKEWEIIFTKQSNVNSI